MAATLDIGRGVEADGAAGGAFYRVESGGVVIAHRVRLAGTSAERRKGLSGLAAWPDFDGLVILPCEAIHTFGMRFTIDVAFLDAERRVRRIHEAVKPNRLRVDWRADCALELPAGRLRRGTIEAGARLEFHSCP